MFLPTCREVQSELTEYAEGALPFRRQLGIRIHLLFCRVCAGFLRGLAALPGISKTLLSPPEAAPDAAARALEQVQAILRNQRRD
jgi:hypothetical protein